MKFLIFYYIHIHKTITATASVEILEILHKPNSVQKKHFVLLSDW